VSLVSHPHRFGFAFRLGFFGVEMSRPGMVWRSEGCCEMRRWRFRIGMEMMDEAERKDPSIGLDLDLIPITVLATSTTHLQSFLRPYSLTPTIYMNHAPTLTSR
jgi:hypothetical protein